MPCVILSSRSDPALCYIAFARLTPEQRGLWEERAEARAQAFCDGFAADLALMTRTPTPARRPLSGELTGSADRAGKAELVTGIEGASSRPVRKIALPG
jgi:hypothetical protein